MANYSNGHAKGLNGGGGGSYAEVDDQHRRSVSKTHRSDMDAVNVKEGDEVVEDGWAFWSQVYSDPDLRREVAESQVNEPSVAEVLYEERQRLRQVIVENLPGNMEEGQLLQELGGLVNDDDNVVRVRINQRRRSVFIQFNSQTSARNAIAKLNNQYLARHRLTARLNCEDYGKRGVGADSIQVPLTQHKDKSVDAMQEKLDVIRAEEKERARGAQEGQQGGACSSAQSYAGGRTPYAMPLAMSSVPPPPPSSTLQWAMAVPVPQTAWDRLLSDLSLLLAKCGGKVQVPSDRLQEVFAGVSEWQCLYELWPIGLMRYVLLHLGDHLATTTHNHITFKGGCVQQTEKKGGSGGGLSEVWEQTVPQQVRTRQQLCEYVHALIIAHGTLIDGGCYELSTTHVAFEYLCACLGYHSIQDVLVELAASQEECRVLVELAASQEKCRVLVCERAQSVWALPLLTEYN